ncbi:DUF1775 domain-containing protein [Streptomyces sp. ITFR-6]|uniref:DUF1775 domain-containing protein n=1 Tax=Streptomyces sp. ITFR-6 TaxID=3075197 RepID=UPI00288AE44D|nr:DUF1775 domain-containing protein [Streptomyces sp. ITFR-6]WNI31666.1 DUF1775 domain-containing protein [Streptomyces sp. ITFR-6]
MAAIAAAAASIVVAAAGTAAAHAEVSASDDRALAREVTLTFESEAESSSAGFTKIQIVLPEGIDPAAVRLAKAPEGWKITPGTDGYTVAGPKLAAGVNAEHSITVAQLPQAKSLAFKTVETYSDGEVSRWIEVPKDGEAEPQNPAPVLKLKAAAADASSLAPGPSPTPSVTASSTAPSPSTSTAPSAQAEENDSDEGSGAGVWIAVAAVVVAAAVGAAWLIRRRRS